MASKFVDKLLIKFEEAVLWIDSFFLVVITGIVCLQVIARKVGISLTGTEELARYSYVIFAFLAWPIAALKGSDICIAFIFDRFPRVVRKYGLVVFHIAMAVFASIAAYSLVLNVINAKGVTAVSNQWLPLSYIFAVVTFGLVVTALFNLVRAYRLFTGHDVYITQIEKDEIFLKKTMAASETEGGKK